MPVVLKQKGDFAGDISTVVGVQIPLEAPISRKEASHVSLHALSVDDAKFCHKS